MLGESEEVVLMDYQKAWEELKRWLTEDEMREYFKRKGDYYRVGLFDGYKKVAEKMEEIEKRYRV